MNKIECPKCLGEGKVYNPFENYIIMCNLCKGNKNVSETLADLYDPIADELSNLKLDENE